MCSDLFQSLRVHLILHLASFHSFYGNKFARLSVGLTNAHAGVAGHDGHGVRGLFDLSFASSRPVT